MEVVTYTYDAWGNVLTTDGSLAMTLGHLNPLRYRGYVYDTETNLYYLQSRYYDPEMGRFINADIYTSTGQELTGNNMFAYCNNNPIIGYDPTGLINWGGFWAGMGVAAIGVGIIATTILSGGSSLIALGTAMASGVMLSGAGALTSYGAATEDPIVFDVSVTDGLNNDKQGYSFVVDFDSDAVSVDAYYHYGKTTGSTGAAVSGGLVFNYYDAGDYGGEFVDVSASQKYHGIDYGIDYCRTPSLSSSACWAVLGTVGVSAPSTQKVTFGFDYYIQVAYWEWG